MQTKRRIQQFLSSAGVRLQKSLGQHFLIDLNLVGLLVDSARICSDDIVLEVGCGTGSLTEELAKRAGRIIAVEIDRALIEICRSQLKDKKNVQLLNTDVLDAKNSISSDVTAAMVDARRRLAGRLLLVANLPYSVASPVMLNLAGSLPVVDGMFVTVQREVASRIVAAPASSDYGTLSVFIQAVGQAKVERVLKPCVFWPRPQVDSAMISFVRNQSKAEQIVDRRLFSQVVNLFMQHRRKMVKACARFAEGELARIGNWEDILKASGIEPSSRPGRLRPQDYVTMSNLCSRQLNK